MNRAQEDLMSRALVVALMALLVLSTSAAAQVAGAGSKQITFAGGGTVGKDYQSLNGTFGITRYVSDNLEIGTFVSGTYSKFGSGGVGELSGYLFGNLTWNFVSQSMTVPFLFAGAGTPLDDESLGDLAFQGGAGFKHFVSEVFSFNGQASMIGQKVGDEVNFGDFVLLAFGFSYYIR
jgi:hypothetical protein